jgi:hypothetical protein
MLKKYLHRLYDTVVSRGDIEIHWLLLVLALLVAPVVHAQEPGGTAIHLTQLHTLIGFAPGTARVIQIFIVGNSGSQPYTGQNGQTFSFSLPEGASEVQFQGSRFIKTKTEAGAGYAATEPILPGPEGLTIAVVYSLPYSGDSLTVEFPLPDEVLAANVLLEEQGVSFNSSPSLEFVKTSELEGTQYALYSGQNLTGTLTLHLTGLEQLALVPASPPATTPAGYTDQEVLRWTTLGLGGLLLLFAAIIYPRRRKVADNSPMQNSRRQRLLWLLARLDETFAAGELEEQVYRQARADYKAELCALDERDV